MINAYAEIKTALPARDIPSRPQMKNVGCRHMVVQMWRR
jgi:hypothetical protein